MEGVFTDSPDIVMPVFSGSTYCSGSAVDCAVVVLTARHYVCSVNSHHICPAPKNATTAIVSFLTGRQLNCKCVTLPY